MRLLGRGHERTGRGQERKDEGRVIGGVGGSGTELVLLLLLLLLLRYEGGGPRLSRRNDGLPCPTGRIGERRAVLARPDVVAKRSMGCVCSQCSTHDRWTRIAQAGRLYLHAFLYPEYPCAIIGDDD